MKNEIIELFSLAITAASEAIALAEENDMTNEQWFLNYLDTLNDLSVKH